MKHPEAGQLRALLDDELSDMEARELRSHVAACGACDAMVRGVEEAQVLTTALLDALDVEPPVDRVRARITEHRRTPIGGARRAPRRFWLGRAELARAALLLLGFAGAVAAAVHPASPVRRWIASEEPVVTPPPSAPEAAIAPSPVREVGVRVAVGDAGVHVTVAGASSGAALELTWLAEGPAAVYAPEGTSFNTSEAQGRIEALMTSAGPVRVELPRGAVRASLVVDGVRYLEKTGERIVFPGPPALVEGERVRFRVP